jgi:hypothetical protein
MLSKRWFHDLCIALTIILAFITAVLVLKSLINLIYTNDDSTDKIKTEQVIIKDNTNNIVYVRDTYAERLESKYYAAREALVIEVENYIKEYAPSSALSALALVNLCGEYGVDIRLPLAQGHVESHFGTKGTASKTNSVWNVGAFDGYSAAKQIRKGYGFKHPDYSIEPYLKLLTTRYLIEGKTEEELLDNFVDLNGNRYASCKEYESKLRCKWNKMVSISEKYDLYKMYKLQLGV